jgi:hypothetical protein
MPAPQICRVSSGMRTAYCGWLRLNIAAVTIAFDQIRVPQSLRFESEEMFGVVAKRIY